MVHASQSFVQFWGYILETGANGGEVPPVPIPNTEVKLTSVDNTWLETAWEDRAVPVQDKKPVTGFFVIYSSLAQSVERSAVNRNVVGSSPTGGAIFLNPGFWKTESGVRLLQLFWVG